jgi:hypothetical protein
MGEPLKYRPHRPQGGKRADLQAFIAVDIALVRCPQIGRYCPQERYIDRNLQVPTAQEISRFAGFFHLVHSMRSMF